MKALIKALVPPSVLRARRRRISEREQRRFAVRSAAETFAEIYENNIWGGRDGEFYSGTGSTRAYADKYAEVVRSFISEHQIKRVVDLGCGDFRVASKFVSPELDYTGCDVVPGLIAHLEKTYGGPKTRFKCLNIAEDELPDGEVCLIRQVLQHLSNAEISAILNAAAKFEYLIVTEHYPHPDRTFTPNLDIPHGPEMRLHFDSAVALDEPPFSLENVSVLLDVEAEEGTRIKTFLVTRSTN